METCGSNWTRFVIRSGAGRACRDIAALSTLNFSGWSLVTRHSSLILMIMHKLFLFTFMLLLSLPVLAQDNDEAGIKTTVENRYQEWLAAENKKDAAAVTDLYDEKAVLLPKQEEPVLGKAAIGEYYKNLFANPNFVPFTLTTNWNSFHVVGDIAIASVLFEGDVTRNGKQIHFRGKELLVWKKQADGSWKIFRYMYDEIPAKK